jgi:hypothetical protein
MQHMPPVLSAAAATAVPHRPMYATPSNNCHACNCSVLYQASRTAVAMSVMTEKFVHNACILALLVMRTLGTKQVAAARYRVHYSSQTQQSTVRCFVSVVGTRRV